MTTAKKKPMPPMPTHVKVGHLVYRVVVGGPEWAEARAEAGDGEGSRLVAHTMHSTQVMSFAPGETELMMRDSMIHECTHALAAAMGNPVEAWDMDSNVEEHVAAFIGSGMTMLLRDNPKLVAWLMAEVPLD
jgi:hypothetical protein